MLRPALSCSRLAVRGAGVCAAWPASIAGTWPLPAACCHSGTRPHRPACRCRPHRNSRPRLGIARLTRFPAARRRTSASVMWRTPPRILSWYDCLPFQSQGRSACLHGQHGLVSIPAAQSSSSISSPRVTSGVRPMRRAAATPCHSAFATVGDATGFPKRQSVDLRYGLASTRAAGAPARHRGDLHPRRIGEAGYVASAPFGSFGSPSFNCARSSKLSSQCICT